MTPTPQEYNQVKETVVADPPQDANSIVISGMSGLYPQSRYIKDFEKILYDKINPITSDLRWKFNHPEAARYEGNIPDLDRFDAQFFKVHYWLGASMDAMSKKMLEQSYEAIYDAGVNPHDISGKKVGVYIGTCFSESEKCSFYRTHSKHGFGIAGCSKSMFANRISYWLNAKGPSVSIDEACCSSTAALEQAYQALYRGECEAAIVGGAYLCLHPQSSVHFSRVMALNKDGKTKSFDQNADGCAISEAVSVLFLQRSKDALRIYAYVKHVKCEFRKILQGKTGPRYGFYRDPEDTAQFFKAFYDEVRIPPRMVEYVEAFGSAVPEADKSELEAIAKVFCKSRNEPLLVGSVMSNIGYGEAASGISAITKDTNQYKSVIPRLVTISGRQESSVLRVLDHLKAKPVDPEELALLNNIHKNSIVGHLGRGYIVLDTNNNQETVSLSEKACYFDDVRRPLWFVYSGMGSQWVGMGTALMRIPVFAKAIARCHQALEPKGLNIIDIISSSDPTTFDNILHSFVGIAAVQIGLTDVLKELGLVPDNIIGHSVGELGCAYADGCLTAEEMILSAYSRGLVSLETKFIRGSMAAVGLGYEQISKICPPEIEVACHNSSESSTISGPEDLMRNFVTDLKNKNIFAKEVPCSNIAYHSRYISSAGPGLLKYLKEVIKTPKERSERWLSTSVPQDKWDEPIAKFSSAEYHTNNLLNPVLFEETSKLIPSNAILVEVAPHGLLQAILKRALPGSCINVALTRRGHPDNALLLLETIGKLFMEGLNPDLKSLYPKVEFPVSTGTPFLSNYVDWAHEEKWVLPLYSSASRAGAASCKHIISINDDDYSYLKGHVIRKNILLPSAFVLVAVWDTLAMVLGVSKRKFNVKFDDIRFYCQPVLHGQRQMRLNVALHRGNGRFEVKDDYSKVASGFIKSVKYLYTAACESPTITQNILSLSTQDVYKLFDERQYSYSGEFRSICCVNDSVTEGQLFWNENWVTLIDGMLQLNALKYAHSAVSRPCGIRSLTINVNDHIINAEIRNGKNIYTALISEIYDFTRCGGIVMKGVKFHNLPHLAGNEVTLKTMRFVPKFPSHSEGIWEEEYVNRNQENADNVVLQSDQVGNIESLKWVESPEVISNGIKVKVHYAGINVDDVRKASGLKPVDDISTATSSYGIDFSGITETGERVMGLAENGSTRSTLIANPELTWPVPSHWSLEDAATVPLAYVYVFYCFFIRITNLIKSDFTYTVLIHGGAGALGQAAISVALAYGYRVFTTVSDLQKKKFLLKLFPDLKEEYIGCSRDISFADMVLTFTAGKGADMVLSCVKGELKDFSLKVCAPFGVTFDTDLVSSMEQHTFGLNNLAYGRTYITVDIRSMFSNPSDIKRIREYMVEGISGGWVRPLSRLTFPSIEAPRAFRLLAASKHRGRVLLQLTDTLNIPSNSRLVFSAHHNHLIVGDSESLVSRLADRLVSRGAKNLHLHLPQTSAVLDYKIKFWQNLEVNVKMSTGDLTDDNVVKMLNQARVSGFLAGIYITNTKLKLSLINKFDIESRKLAPYLKYFLILEFEEIDRNVYQICLKRCNDGLSTTYLKVKHLEKTHHDDFDWFRDIIESIEQSLCCQHPVVISNLTPATRKPLQQEIVDTVGIKIVENSPNTTTLQELGLEQEKSTIVSTFLNDMYNVYVEENHIHSLTLEKLKEIQNNISEEKEFTDTKDFDSFFTFVDPDELLATIEIVFLPTQSNSSVMGEDEFDQNETYLLIVPGMEGHHARFRTLCERLKLPALVLQPGLDYLQEDSHLLATRYFKVLMKKMELKKKFYVLGFESGVSVALELAALLEKQGLTGTVYCVGDGPKETVEFVEEKLKNFSNEEELQRGLIEHMFKLLAGSECEYSEVEKAMSGCSTWSQRVEMCVRILLGRVSHSAQYARSLIDAAYSRLLTARHHVLTPKLLQSQIVLVRALTAHAHSARTSLQDYSSQPVIVYDLPTPLARITEDLRCTAIINRHLSKDIIEAFNKKSLCDSYLINADSFMVSRAATR